MMLKLHIGKAKIEDVKVKLYKLNILFLSNKNSCLIKGDFFRIMEL